MSTGPPTINIPPPQPTDASPTGGSSPSPSTSGDPGNPGNNSMQSSASLYLYTFLATLVLLLVVSAAIVVRSFVLRRRHRMMIEEAIRNGTLFPPLATGYGLRTRVDLSKKPKIWDAWIEKQEQPTSGRSREKEWYWDMMKPLSAVYVVPAGSRSSGNRDDYSSSNRQGTMSSRQSLRVRVGSAARHAGRTLAHYVSTRPSINTPHSSSQSSSTQLSSPTVLADLSSGYATVKVAVLIAMPRKSATKGSPPFSPSSSLQPLHSLLPSHDEEEQLPHLEMGVTEVRVMPSPDDNAPDLGKSNMGTV
ncbi:hypothetical protein APHAL10511_007599 [Amanita phalloides]|nr:hypothetical protein APHAL10511_007599 [Amanita phalloides]